jgi:hypothetical protein
LKQRYYSVSTSLWPQHCRLPEAALRALAHRGEGDDEASSGRRGASSSSSRRLVVQDEGAIKAARVRQALLVLMVRSLGCAESVLCSCCKDKHIGTSEA